MQDLTYSRDSGFWTNAMVRSTAYSIGFVLLSTVALAQESTSNLSGSLPDRPANAGVSPELAKLASYPSVTGQTSPTGISSERAEAGAANATEAEIAELSQGLMELKAGIGQLESGLKKVGTNLTVSTVDKKWGIGIFGSLTAETIFAESRPLIPSGIVLLTPDFGKNTSTFEAHAKSSSLGAALKGPRLGSFDSGGLILSYFYGEEFLADAYGFYLVRAFGELKNDQARYAFGYNGDVINPLSPTTLNYNAGNGAGNLGFFRGQFLAERFLKIGESQLTLQLALSDPVTTAFTDLSVPPNNLLESNGWPNVEGRIAFGLGEKTELWGGRNLRALEVGVSGLIGELRRTDIPTNPNRELQVWACGLDAEVPLTERLGLRGEYFYGQAIGNYNAGIIQVFNGNIEEIRSAGGWGEAYCYFAPCLHSHLGYSIDNPLDSTLTPGLPTKNQNAFANIIWNATGNLELGFEVSYWDTDYTPAPALGPFNPRDADAMVYHSRVRFSF